MIIMERYDNVIVVFPVIFLNQPCVYIMELAMNDPINDPRIYDERI